MLRVMTLVLTVDACCMTQVIQVVKTSYGWGQYSVAWMNKVPRVNCLLLRPRSYDMHISKVDVDRKHSGVSNTV
jgi:hypothetical protein